MLCKIVQSMPTDRLIPFIQICSRESARESDISAYDGVITIEDTTEKNPFRVELEYPLQLVLRFDDIQMPVDQWVAADDSHVRSALNFARQWDQPSLLIHCTAGISRSPAIALAVLADCYGKGREVDSIKELLKSAILCKPNKRVVEIADRLLVREGRLLEELSRIVDC